MNLSPTALLDPRFGAAWLSTRIRAAGFAPEQIVFEISELENVGDPERFAQALRPLRDAHFQLAIDDFELAAEVKTAAKQTTGPVVLVNQRSLPT